MTDYTKILDRLLPRPDGESAIRHRAGVVTALNSDGTVDVEISGVEIPSVSCLAGAPVDVGDTVQIAAWRGDLLILGRARTLPTGDSPTLLAAHTVPASPATNQITISNIPGTHSDLIVIAELGHTGSGFQNWGFQINGVSSGYTRVGEYRDGADATDSTVSASAGDFALLPTLSPLLGGTKLHIEIPGYTTGFGKHCRYWTTARLGPAAGATRIGHGGGASSVTNPVTSITLLAGGGNDFVPGSTVRVYGRR